MQYVKKIVVLKEIVRGFSVCDKPVSGIVRVEIEDGVANLFLSFVNFRSSRRGTYAFCLSDGEGAPFFYELGTRPASFARVMERLPNVEKGFAAGVCLIEDDLPTLTTFGRTDECELTVTDMKSVAAEKCLQLRKQRLKAEEAAKNLFRKEEKSPPKEEDTDLSAKPRKNKEDSEEISEENFKADEANESIFYDDEAVATENYYETKTGENENVTLQFENELSYVGGEKEEKEESADAYRAQNEEDFGDGEEFSRSRPYYLTVKDELKEIFSKFPEESSLKKLFPDSEFSRVNYSADKFYVVGLIKESGEEKYICYGVPGAYSENAPEELAPYCSFIPVSIFDLSGDGYWMMFQSATTGECILLNQNK